MEHADLERVVDEALHALPAPRAPETLLPRIMAAVAARATVPAYAKPWAMWPRVWQIASAAALAIVVSGLARFWTLTAPVRDGVLADFAPAMPDWLARVVNVLSISADALRIGWRVLAEPVLIPVTVFLCVMTAACMVFAVALNRVALGGASES